MSSTLPKVFLVGGAGVPNFGDELIVDGWLRWYTRQRALPAAHVTVSGSSAAVLRRLFAARYPGLHTTDAMVSDRPKLTENSTFDDYVAAGYRFLTDKANAGSSLARQLPDIDIFHMHGGGYLNAVWPRQGFMVGVGRAAKELTGCRLVATGLGLGPLDDLTTEGSATELAFSAFDLLEVRDGWSHDFLTRNRLHADPVLGLDDAFLQPITSEERQGATLHVSLFDDKLSHDIVERLDHGTVGSYDHHVFWACTRTDVSAYRRLLDRFPFFRLKTTVDLLEALPLSDVNHVYTQRFHPHLVLARTAAQGMFFSGSGYYDTKHGSLVTLGSPFIAGSADALQLETERGSAMAAHDAENLARKRALAEQIMPVQALSSAKSRVQLTGSRLGEGWRRVADLGRGILG